jgi:hypothetical protein
MRKLKLRPEVADLVRLLARIAVDGYCAEVETAGTKSETKPRTIARRLPKPKTEG